MTSKAPARSPPYTTPFPAPIQLIKTSGRFVMETATGRRFVVANTSTRGEQLCDRMLLIRPLHTEVIPTKLGDAEATFAEVIEVIESGDPVLRGEFPIFWSVVQQQLLQATAAQPWVAGRLCKVGNAYRLDPLTQAEAALADKAMAQVQAE